MCIKFWIIHTVSRVYNPLFLYFQHTPSLRDSKHPPHFPFSFCFTCLHAHSILPYRIPGSVNLRKTAGVRTTSTLLQASSLTFSQHKRDTWAWGGGWQGTQVTSLSNCQCHYISWVVSITKSESEGELGKEGESQVTGKKGKQSIWGKSVSWRCSYKKPAAHCLHTESTLTESLLFSEY